MPVSYSKTPISILICDSHQLVRDGLRLLVQTRPHMEIVGEAGTALEAIRLAKDTKPSVILLELNLDGTLDTGIIPELLSAAPQAKVILVTGVDDNSVYHDAVAKGAMGIIQKKMPSDTLLKAIEKVHSGEVWVDRTMMAKVLTGMSRARLGLTTDPDTARIEQLTDREREVITLIGDGLKNKDIADRLSISEVTVRHHLTSIYNKLDVSDRLELIIFAYRNELAVLPP